MFNGDFRKRKNVSMRPKNFVDPFTQVLDVSRQVPQQAQQQNHSAAQVNSRFERRTKDQTFCDGAVARRRQREYEKCAVDAAVKIQATFRMYRVRRRVCDEAQMRSCFGVNTEKLNFTTRALLQYGNTVYSRNSLPMNNSLELFAYLANLLQRLQNKCEKAAQDVTRLRRQLQYNTPAQELIFARSAARVSPVWFAARLSSNLSYLPWEMVRRMSASTPLTFELQSQKRQVLKDLLTSNSGILNSSTANFSISARQPYLDGYITLSDTVAVLEAIDAGSNFSRLCRRPSLFQRKPEEPVAKLSADDTLRIFTYSKVPESTPTAHVAAATQLITEMLQVVPYCDAHDHDDDDMADDEIASGERTPLPVIISIFNQLNAQLFTKMDLTLDTLGNLVSTLLRHHSRIEDILVLQKVSENDRILAQFTRFLCDNLAQANKVQIRKYIRSSNDFNTWFKILSFRLSQVRDELWLSKDGATVVSVELFMGITEYLRELICLCCAPGSGQTQVSPALLTIVNRLAMLNTIRAIENFDSKFEIRNPSHPLVIRLAALVHPASSNQIFLDSLDKLLSSDSRNTEAMQNYFTNQSDAWLGSVLANAPSLLNLEDRYSLFNTFAQRTVLRYSHRGQSLRVRRGHIYEDAYQAMLDSPSNNKLRALRVQFIDQQGLEEVATGRGVVLEFMNLFMKEAFDNDKHLFKPSPHSNKLFPNEEAFRYVPNAKEHYYLIGQLLGTCILAGLQIAVPIARFVIKDLFYQGNLHTVSDLAELDEDLFQNLMSLRDMDPQEVDRLSLDFTYNVSGKNEAVELIVGGKDKSVTKENRLLYIELVAKLKLSTGISAQLNSMRDGLNTVLPLHWLRLFNPTEVEFLLYGNEIDKIDVNDWQAHTTYKGFTEESDTIKLFWRVLRTRFSQEDLAKLLAFTTSLHRPPLLGFKQLAPKFTIMNNVSSDVLETDPSEAFNRQRQGADNVRDIQRMVNAAASTTEQANLPPLTPAQRMLPSAATCFNLLRMPPYNDEETLYQKLHLAIYEVEGFQLG